MSKKTLILVIIGLVLAVGAGLYLYFFQYKKVVDCGTDQNCFTENLKSCTPTKFYGGAWIIKGGSIKSCEVYQEGTDPSDLKKNIGMTCIINVGDYEEFTKQGVLANINMYILSKLENCQGPLKDQLQSIFDKSQEIIDKSKKQ